MKKKHNLFKNKITIIFITLFLLSISCSISQTEKQSLTKTNNNIEISNKFAVAVENVTIDYNINSSWNAGFVAIITITNNENFPIEEWELKWNFKDNETIQNLWGGDFTQTSNNVVVKYLNYNKIIPPGGNIVVGFVANYTGIHQEPDNFELSSNSSSSSSSSISSSSSSSTSSSSSSSISSSSSSSTSSSSSSSISSSSSSSTSSSSSSSQPYIVLTTDWARHYEGEYIIFNNVWGKEDLVQPDDYTQYIYLETENSLCPFGWAWDWPQTADGRVKSYPEIYIGYNPFDSNAVSNTNRLPVSINNLNTFTAEYDIESTASGRYNLAFEFWLTNNPEPREENITSEVMIWMDYNNWQWFPPLIEQVTIDGEVYNFHKGNVDHGSWSYICFVKINPEYTGNTKFHKFIEYLINNNHINQNDYVSCLDLGNEVIHGSGETRFLEYSVIID